MCSFQGVATYLKANLITLLHPNSEFIPYSEISREIAVSQFTMSIRVIENSASLVHIFFSRCYYLSVVTKANFIFCYLKPPENISLLQSSGYIFEFGSQGRGGGLISPGIFNLVSFSKK